MLKCIVLYEKTLLVNLLLFHFNRFVNSFVKNAARNISCSLIDSTYPAPRSSLPSFRNHHETCKPYPSYTKKAKAVAARPTTIARPLPVTPEVLTSS